jgi:hypothetical protein
LCTLLIAVTFTVLHIRVLWVNTEEPVDSEPNVPESHNKQKGKIRVTALDTSASDILSDKGQAD